MFPNWYKELISKFALYGEIYDIDKKGLHINGISFPHPEMFECDLNDLSYEYPALINSDYFPIGITDNAEFFICKRNEESSVHGLEMDYTDGSYCIKLSEEIKWCKLKDYFADLIPESYE